MLGQLNGLNNYNNYGFMPTSYVAVPNYSSLGNANPSAYSQLGAQYIKSYVYPQINRNYPVYYTQPSTIQRPVEIPWIKDPVIKDAINKLREVRYLPGDVEHMRNLGVNIIYNSGEEAIKTIFDRGINIVFGEVSNPKVHAQLDNDNNLVIINKKYKDTQNPAVILAISEAIFHELGHAKDNDGVSSIQEEIDCLALNTLANRYHQQVYPEIFNSPNGADILNDGVSLYTKLFFDPDPRKEALANRVILKYGDLPMESPNHKLPVSALIASKLNSQNA